MARVYTKKAGKDYPEQGIMKGDTYYEWAFYRQKPRKSKTRPTRAQLTQNDFLVTVYSAFDSDLPQITCGDDLRAIASAIRDAGEELRNRFEELPEGFQQGETGQEMERRADAADTCANEMDEAADTLDEELERIEEWADYIRREEEGEVNEDEEPEGERPESLDGARDAALEEARQSCNEGDW